jgi:hypothetical protein
VELSRDRESLLRPKQGLSVLYAPNVLQNHTRSLLRFSADSYREETPGFLSTSNLVRRLSDL